jgi:sodium-dependent phosphate transporter
MSSASIDTAPLLWLVIATCVAGTIVAFGMGANDVSNAFATSVGAKSVTLRQALFIAAIFEFGGAVLMGSRVADTISGGLISPSAFADRPDLLLLGMFCAAAATGIWLIAATALSLPVSTTHSIIGAVLGFALCQKGAAAIAWGSVGRIVASWFLSPALAAIVSASVFTIVRAGVLRSEASTQRALRMMPVFCLITVSVNVFFIVYKGSPALGLEHTPVWASILISLAVAAVCAALVEFCAGPRILRRAMAQSALFAPLATKPRAERSSSAGVRGSPVLGASPSLAVESGQHLDEESHLQSDPHLSGIHSRAEKFDPTTEGLFSVLQVATAVFMSFAHGSNDVSNSIGPIAAAVAVYRTGSVASVSDVPLWILALGGAGIVAGLASFGYRVMVAIGVKLTKVTPSRGFAIEFTTAFVVLVGSRLSLPLSTTHCQVGSTMGVGLAEGSSGVNWRAFRGFFIAWVATLLVAGSISASLYSFAAFSPTSRFAPPLLNSTAATIS